MRSDAFSPRRNTDVQYAAAVKNYESAVLYIQKHNYNKAEEILKKLVTGGPAEVADRARVHLRRCEQRLQSAAQTLKTAEDFYVAGVSDLNARRLERAIEYLTKADKLEPNREEIHYALAAAYALERNAEAAMGHLKASIELRPQNRFQARHDEDFQALASDPRFTSLVNPGQSVTANPGS